MIYEIIESEKVVVRCDCNTLFFVARPHHSMVSCNCPACHRNCVIDDALWSQYWPSRELGLYENCYEAENIRPINYDYEEPSMYCDHALPPKEFRALQKSIAQTADDSDGFLYSMIQCFQKVSGKAANGDYNVANDDLNNIRRISRNLEEMKRYLDWVIVMYQGKDISHYYEMRPKPPVTHSFDADCYVTLWNRLKNFAKRNI